MSRSMLRIGIWLVAISAIAVACASVESSPNSPRAEGPNWPASGSSWVSQVKTTGSYGSTSVQKMDTMLGEQIWQGQRVMAISDGEITIYFDLQGQLVARMRDTVLIESFEPYFKAFDWPIFTGKRWENRYRYHDHVQGRVFDDVRQDVAVKAYEVINTPAGAFNVFRIVYEDRFFRMTMWWSPELGIVVKSLSERLNGHYLGMGTRESVLVSHNVRR